MYRKIDFNCVIKPLEKLENRINERFLNVWLFQVCHELLDTAGETQTKLVRLSMPSLLLGRFVTLVVLSSFVIIYTVSLINMNVSLFGFSEFVQAVESSSHDLMIITVKCFQ